MIRRVTVRYFKRFEAQEFTLADHVVLAGPNNSGKTTLLQALAAWSLAMQRWVAERGPGTGSTAKRRTGVPVTRKDFTAIPLRELKLLWTDTLTALKLEDADDLAGGRKPGYPRTLEICLHGDNDGVEWDIGFEFRYQNSELLYVKPRDPKPLEDPELVRSVRIVHVPPFSGIGAEETRYDRPYQDLLVGQGKAGDILRNLLLEVHQQPNSDGWSQLVRRVEDVFGYRLLPPEYKNLPYIRCEYLPGVPTGPGRNGLHPLDISNAGSGFHQVLLLLGFLYARPATVLLLDEPDAHLHVILQKQIHDELQKTAAKRKCQLVIATHSEVLLDATSPDHVLSFYGKPHVLVDRPQRDQVREALRRLTAMDILLAEGSQGVLYVEDETDFNLLRAWATILGHRTAGWFRQKPFYHPNKGRSPREAAAHFFALRAVRPGISGYLLLDGDNRGLPDHEVRTDGLVVSRWARYEAESYLIHPGVLTRFLDTHAAKGEAGQQTFLGSMAMEYLKDELPGAVLRDPLGQSDYLDRTPASKTLLPGLFSHVGADLPKTSYYLIAEQMRPEEIPAEVTSKLGEIAEALGL